MKKMKMLSLFIFLVTLNVSMDTTIVFYHILGKDVSRNDSPTSLINR